jgi:hypothetical protein
VRDVCDGSGGGARNGVIGWSAEDSREEQRAVRYYLTALLPHCATALGSDDVTM